VLLAYVVLERERERERERDWLDLLSCHISDDDDVVVSG
jgi:hypothetical protein